MRSWPVLRRRTRGKFMGTSERFAGDVGKRGRFGTAAKLNRAGDPGQVETRIRVGSRAAIGQSDGGVPFTIQFLHRGLAPIRRPPILWIMSEDASRGPGSSAQAADETRWVATWAGAGAALEQVRREELRQLDTLATIALLCGPADYHQPPFAPEPTSGLVEQQCWFAKVAART